MHNQPDVVPLTIDKEKSSKKRHAEGPPPPPSPPPPPVNPGQDESNVGNKLLKMMGWKEGTGLGTSGEGRIDPMFAYFLPLVTCSDLACFEVKLQSTLKEPA